MGAAQSGFLGGASRASQYWGYQQWERTLWAIKWRTFVLKVERWDIRRVTYLLFRQIYEFELLRKLIIEKQRIGI